MTMSQGPTSRGRIKRGATPLLTGRRRFLAALAAAFLLLPAAQALAIEGHIVFEGEGSGWVIGRATENEGGKPNIKCHWNGHEIDIGTGPAGAGGESGSAAQAGHCDTELQKFSGIPGLSVESEADAGSKLTGWEVLEGSTAGGCHNPASPGEGCGVITFTKPIKIKAIFATSGPPPLALTINEPGTGSGQVNCEVNGGPTVDKPCASSYPEGTELKLIVVEDTGSEFVEFENGTGSAEACSTSPCGPFKLEAASELDANFALETRELEIEEEGPGTVEVQCKEGASFEPCANPLSELDYGTEVKVTAEPDTGAEIEEFAGTNSATGCEAEGSPCTFTLTEDSEVSVIFVLETFALAIEQSGEGTVEEECDEGSGFGPCGPLSELSYGTQVKLTAEEETGWEFSAWSGDCDTKAANVCELEMDAAKSVEATFVKVGQKTLTIVTSGGTGTGQVNCEVNGGPTVDKPCKTEYTEGTKLKLIPVEGANSTFAGYNTPTGSISCTGKATCEFTIAANSSVNAPFNLEKHLLTVTKAGSGTGTVTSNPAGINCGVTCSAEFDHGKEVTLEAVSGANTKPVEWSGACTVEAGKCKVTMSAAKAVTATFPLEKHTLTVTKAGSGTGTVTCNGTTCASEYDYGTELTLAATAASGSSFAGFSAGTGSAAGCSTSPCKVTIEADTAVTATFDANPAPTCATDPSLCPPPPPAEEKCIVPKLAKKTLGQAKTALAAAHCALGKVTKPKAKKGKKLGPLVVKSSSPGAGTTLPAGSKVNLKLGPKPKKK